MRTDKSCGKTADKAYRINKYYGIALSIFTAVLAVLFISQSLAIFAAGDFRQGAYSRDIVAERILPLNIVMLFWIAAAIVAFALSEAFPVNSRKAKTTDEKGVLLRLMERVPESADGFAELKKIKKEEITRLVLRAVFAVMCIAFAVVCAIYVFNEKNFPAQNLNGEVFGMFKLAAPLLVIAAGAGIGLAMFEKYSVRREIAAVKTLIAAGEKGCAVKNPLKSVKILAFMDNIKAFLRKIGGALSSNAGLWTVRGIVIVVGIVFVILGVTNGGMRDVFVKAVNICTECIGLG